MSEKGAGSFGWGRGNDSAAIDTVHDVGGILIRQFVTKTTPDAVVGTNGNASCSDGAFLGEVLGEARIVGTVWHTGCYVHAELV